MKLVLVDEIPFLYALPEELKNVLRPSAPSRQRMEPPGNRRYVKGLTISHPCNT